VTRETLDGKNPDGWIPRQKISVQEALAAYTTGAAWAAFRERDLGTLAAGKLAGLRRARPAISSRSRRASCARSRSR
jgi:predicted amidohydrolase YtcJ